MRKKFFLLRMSENSNNSWVIPNNKSFRLKNTFKMERKAYFISSEQSLPNPNDGFGINMGGDHTRVCAWSFARQKQFAAVINQRFFGSAFS